MLLGFLTTTTIVAEIVRLIIKKVGKTWLYTSISRYAKQICFQNIHVVFSYGTNINISSWSAFTTIKIKQDPNDNSYFGCF